MNKKTNEKKLFPYLAGGLALVLILTFIAKRTDILDTIRSKNFSSSPEISELEEKLELTPAAAKIFRASFPTLDSNNEFNENCASYDSNTAVLGCFTEEKIHIYNINSIELSGIVESTAAHELLHAIWNRLSGFEKAKLSSELEEVYKENLSLLSEVMQDYDERDKFNELYARIGTEISDLPESLENHYESFFKDREKIVSFYENYATTFNSLLETLKSLESEIETLNLEVKTLNENYKEKYIKFEKAVSEFNSCAATPNCFDKTTFNARRIKLIGEQEKLNIEFENLNRKIEKLNTKISEYNENLIHGKNLEIIINSNSIPSEI